MQDGLSEKRALAFAMVTHVRLGAASVFHKLPPEVVQNIVAIICGGNVSKETIALVKGLT